MDDLSSEEKAKKYIKEHVKELIEEFASVDKYPPVKNPFTIFMAGSPGAGKTEFSKAFISLFEGETKIVRIDADEVRGLIPFYDKGCAYRVQGAASIGVDKLFDSVQKHHQNAVLDGTFADFNISFRDVERAVNRGRRVGIFYIYQDPLIAWDFTKKREVVEGRRVTKEVFIKAFLESKNNVNKVKEILGSKIELYLVKKDYLNGIEKTHFNIDKIDNYLKIEYDRARLEKELE